MRIFLVATIFLICLCQPVAFFVFADGDAEMRVLLVIHSYDTDYAWTRDENRGIKRAFREVLGKKPDWELREFYLGGKKYKEDPEKMQSLIERMKQQIVDLRPHAALIMDDLAFMSFYTLLRDMGIPVSFGGINGYIEDYGYSHRDRNVTGALEHTNYAAVVRMIDSISPDMEEVAFVGDQSRTTDGMIKSIKRGLSSEDYSTVQPKRFSFVTTGSFKDLKRYLRRVDPARTAVIFISQYTLDDESGRLVSRKEVDRWIHAHTRLLDAGITSVGAPYGRFISWISSAEEIGYYCTRKLLEAVRDGKDLSEVPIRRYQPIRIVINESRARALGVSLPYDLLSYVLNTTRFYEMWLANNSDGS